MGKWICFQVKGLLFALPLMLLVFGLYYGYLFPEGEKAGLQTPLLLVLALVILCVLLHEGLHGAGWMLFGKSRTCRVVFQRRGFLPVCTCRGPLSTPHYLAGLLFPLWLMGGAGIISLLLSPGSLSLTVVQSALFLSGRDIREAFSILKNKECQNFQRIF